MKLIWILSAMGFGITLATPIKMMEEIELDTRGVSLHL